MTDAICFLAPPDPAYDHSRKVECRALVPVGHPFFDLTPALIERIVDLLLEGKTIREIGKMAGMPSTATIRRRIVDDEDFRRKYLLGREGFIEDTLESILEDVNDTSNDHEEVPIADGATVVRVNKDAIARSVHKVATKFKIIAKMAPRKYGDNRALVDPRHDAAPAQPGDDAKVVEGEALPIDAQHPLYDQIVAWGKAARSAQEG